MSLVLWGPVCVIIDRDCIIDLIHQLQTNKNEENKDNQKDPKAKIKFILDIEKK